MLTENEIVEAVCAYLKREGFTVQQQLSTIEHGIDIKAVHNDSGRSILIEAKGGTSSKDSTRRFGMGFSVGQAKSHVAVAFYYVARLLQNPEYQGSTVALAFPDDTNHRILVSNISSSLHLLGVTIFFVESNHEVVRVGPELPVAGYHEAVRGHHLAKSRPKPPARMKQARPTHE